MFKIIYKKVQHFFSNSDGTDLSTSAASFFFENFFNFATESDKTSIFFKSHKKFTQHFEDTKKVEDLRKRTIFLNIFLREILNQLSFWLITSRITHEKTSKETHREC